MGNRWDLFNDAEIRNLYEVLATDWVLLDDEHLLGEVRAEFERRGLKLDKEPDV